jgi:hypothetical protein
MSVYRLFIPPGAAGASKVHFDLFNAAGSACDLDILSVTPIMSGAVAVTGVVAVDLALTRTSAVGTGGTAATQNGTALDAATISPHSAGQVVNANITARAAPSGGATAGALLSYRSLFSEETNAGTYTPAVDMARPMGHLPPIEVKQGTGIRVVQGSVASVGNIGFDVVFKVRQAGGA